MRRTIAWSMLIFWQLTSQNISFAQNGASGYIYDDALAFQKYLTNHDTVKLINLIGYYFKESQITSTMASQDLAGNEFLKRYSGDPIFVGGTGSTSATASGIGNSLGNLNVTNYADGIAKFLIERGKEELSMAFFDKFKSDLKKYPELTYLFPITTDIINSIENHNIMSLLQELKDAFMKDLINIPGNILSLRNIDSAKCNDEKCKARIAQINSFFNQSAGVDSRMVIVPLLIVQGIINGSNIIDIMNSVTADNSICDKADNISGNIQMSSLILESLRSSSPANGLFITRDQINELVTKPVLFNTFLGLVYQKYNTQQCYTHLSIGGNSLKDILLKMRSAESEVISIFSTITQTGLYLKNIQDQLTAGNQVDIKQYISLSSGFMDLIPAISNSVKRMLNITADATDTRLFKNLNVAENMSTDIIQKNYAGLFNDAIIIINENNIFADKTQKEKFIKYFSFAANLAAATNSEEVKEAINSVALPPGSYSVKQKSGWNASLNGYIGYNWNFKGAVTKENQYAKGIYAPLGISVSKGLSRKCGGAITLFASIIDVGSIASYRLSTNMTDTLKQEIRLESIFSPGVQLFFVVPRTPLAVGCGWRSTPKLFYSGNTDFITLPSKDVFTIAILIDIPIFNIYNRPYEN